MHSEFHPDIGHNAAWPARRELAEVVWVSPDQNDLVCGSHCRLSRFGLGSRALRAVPNRQKDLDPELGSLERRDLLRLAIGSLLDLRRYRMDRMGLSMDRHRCKLHRCLRYELDHEGMDATSDTKAFRVCYRPIYPRLFAAIRHGLQIGRAHV